MKCRHDNPEPWSCPICKQFICLLQQPPPGHDFPELLIPVYLKPRKLRDTPPLNPMPKDEHLYTVEDLHKLRAGARDYPWPSLIPISPESLRRLQDEHYAHFAGVMPQPSTQLQELSPGPDFWRENMRESFNAQDFHVQNRNVRFEEITPERKRSTGFDRYLGKAENQGRKQTKLIHRKEAQGQKEDNNDDSGEPYSFFSPGSKAVAESMGTSRRIAPRTPIRSRPTVRLVPPSPAVRYHSTPERPRQKPMVAPTPLRSILKKKRISIVRLRSIKEGRSRRPRLSFAKRVSHISKPTVRFVLPDKSPVTLSSIRHATPEKATLKRSPVSDAKRRKSRKMMTRQAIQQEAVNKAAALRHAKSQAVASQRIKEREAAREKIAQEREKRLQDARNKVKAVKSRTEEPRQRRKLAYQAFQQQFPPPEFYERIYSLPLPCYDTPKLSSTKLPKKYIEWEERKELVTENLRNLFSLTLEGRSMLQGSTSLKLRPNIGFNMLERLIYLPPIPDIPPEYIKAQRMNFEGIDININSSESYLRKAIDHWAAIRDVVNLEDQSFNSDIAESGMFSDQDDPARERPWGHMAKSKVDELSDVFYYIWRIAHNYGYFGWPIPESLPRFFRQAVRFGQLDRVWDEVFAKVESEKEEVLEAAGLNEKMTMLRLAS